MGVYSMCTFRVCSGKYDILKIDLKHKIQQRYIEYIYKYIIQYIDKINYKITHRNSMNSK